MTRGTTSFPTSESFGFEIKFTSMISLLSSPIRVFIGPRKCVLDALPTAETSVKTYTATDTCPSFDLYYRVDVAESSKGTVEVKKPWLPSWDHAAGWGHFVGLPPSLLGGVSTLAFGGTQLPVSSDGPVVSSGLYKIILWSHGLATWGSHYSLMSTLLSSITEEPAIVVAINHTDGSATASELKGGGKVLYEVIGKDRSREMEIRGRQIKCRVQDVGEVWEEIKKMNQDRSSPFFSKLDVSSGFVVSGHSFGGGTAVSIAGSNPDCVGAIALDPWMFPAEKAGYLHPEKMKSCKRVLAITCDKGPLSSPDYWRRNCELLSKLPKESSTLLRFCGSDHIDISDAALMIPAKYASDMYFLEHRRYFRSFFDNIGWRSKRGGVEDATAENTVEKDWVQKEEPF